MLKKTIAFTVLMALSLSSNADNLLNDSNELPHIDKNLDINEKTEEDIVNEIASKNIEYPHYAVGISYLKNKLLPYDIEKALFWLAQSSEIENNDKADYLIAEMYFKGQVPSNQVDYKKAIFFYERSANRGNLEAMLKLSAIYLFDEVLFNQKSGLKWLEKSKELKSSTGHLFFYLLTLNKDDINTIQKSLDYHLFANTKNSNFTLGYLYLTGKGVERDFEKSREYFVKSLSQGISISEIFIVQIDKILLSLQEKVEIKK